MKRDYKVFEASLVTGLIKECFVAKARAEQIEHAPQDWQNDFCAYRSTEALAVEWLIATQAVGIEKLKADLFHAERRLTEMKAIYGY